MTPLATGPRVLQVVLSLNPGGTERLVLELVKRLDPQVPTMVCCLDEPGSWAVELAQRGVHVSSLGRRAGFHPGLGRKIAAAARAHRATVIHAHHYSPFVYSCLARIWAPGCRLVFTEHGRLSDIPPSAKRRAVNGLLRHVPARVFAVSEDLKRHLVGEGFPARVVEVAHNGIDIGPLPDEASRHKARAGLNVSADTLVIGTIARLDPVKDLGMLIDAAARLKTRGPVEAPVTPFKVIVVGDGPERRALEQTAASMGLSDTVVFMGHRDDARAWLAGCDVYVNCSRSEGVSLTILEAMAAGLPVIATRVGGNPEVIDDTCGRLVAARDAAGLADAIAAVQSAQLFKTLGAAGRRRVETSFTIERMVGIYRNAYEMVA